MILPYDHRFLEKGITFAQRKIPFSITALLIALFFVGLVLELRNFIGS